MLLVTYDDLRELRHELQFHFPRMMTECLPWPSFSLADFGGKVLGLAGTIGLCGFRPLARFVYTSFALWLLAETLPDFVRLSAADSFLWLIYAVVVATLALCFIWSFPKHLVSVPPRPLAP